MESATPRPRNHALLAFKDVKGVIDDRAAARAIYADFQAIYRRGHYTSRTIGKTAPAASNCEIPPNGPRVPFEELARRS